MSGDLHDASRLLDGHLRLDRDLLDGRFTTEFLQEILLDVARSHPHVLKDEGLAPSVSVVDLADSSINLKVFVWVDDLENRFGVMADIRQETVKRYKEAGIEIPFPQMDIHMRE